MKNDSDFIQSIIAGHILDAYKADIEGELTENHYAAAGVAAELIIKEYCSMVSDNHKDPQLSTYDYDGIAEDILRSR